MHNMQQSAGILQLGELEKIINARVDPKVSYHSRCANLYRTKYTTDANGSTLNLNLGRVNFIRKAGTYISALHSNCNVATEGHSVQAKP